MTNKVISNFELGGLSSMITVLHRKERREIMLKYNNTFKFRLELFAWEQIRLFKFFFKKLPFIGKKKNSSSVFNVKAGKHRRFESLVGAYSTDLYRFAYWLCGDHSIADDLVQETFLRAWKALDNLEDEKKAKSWLLTILRRENARRFERKRLDLVDIESCSIEDEHIQSPEQLTEQGELHRAILQLDKNYREPLLLQTIGGFNTAEIARMLKLNMNTINTRLFRARNQLKKALMITDECSEKGLQQF